MNLGRRREERVKRTGEVGFGFRHDGIVLIVDLFLALVFVAAGSIIGGGEEVLGTDGSVVADGDVAIVVEMIVIGFCMAGICDAVSDDDGWDAYGSDGVLNTKGQAGMLSRPQDLWVQVPTTLVPLLDLQ